MCPGLQKAWILAEYAMHPLYKVCAIVNVFNKQRFRILECDYASKLNICNALINIVNLFTVKKLGKEVRTVYSYNIVLNTSFVLT